MKRKIAVLIVLLSLWAYTSCLQNRGRPEQRIAHILLAQIKLFSRSSVQLQHAVSAGAPGDELRLLFLKTRLAYKRMEWAMEYFVPATSRLVNGPPVPEVEMSGTVFEPQGLQVIESLLYPRYDKTDRQELIRRIRLLQAGCERYTAYFTHIDILDWQVFDAAKLEVFRVLTLGLTGFDTPLAQSSLEESAHSLEALEEIMALYTDNEESEQVVEKLAQARTYLNHHRDFNTFDRAVFITRYGNAITIAMSRLEQKLNIRVIRYNRLLNQDAATLFDKNAFNAAAFIPDQSCLPNPQKIALGEKLFADPVLSGNHSRSCASCHQPDMAFADGLAKNKLFDGSGLLVRNTPTLLNAALQPAQFYDTRVIMLEDQAAAVIGNKDEMHGDLQQAAVQLGKDLRYRKLFTQAFSKQGRNEISGTEVVQALAAYVRSLTALDSRFDAYMRGDGTAMSPAELHGFNLFMGKARCGTCHYMPLFNGAFPPRFMRMETEIIGVPQSVAGAALDTDMGRYNIVKADFFKHAFKTTTLRNAARTAPYMHNGVFVSLDQVVDFYNKGGGAGLGIRVPNQTLPPEPLNLSVQECNDLVAFIRTLDSR